MNRIAKIIEAADRTRAAVRADVGIDPVTKWDEYGDAEQTLLAAACLPDEPVEWEQLRPDTFRSGTPCPSWDEPAFYARVWSKPAGWSAAIWPHCDETERLYSWRQDEFPTLDAAKTECERRLRLLAAATRD